MKRTIIVPDDTLWFKGVTAELKSPTNQSRTLTYTPGTTVRADGLETDPNLECVPGIFFCRSLPEALRWARGGKVVSVRPIGTIIDTGSKLRAKSVEVVAVVNLSKAILSGADLSRANLSEAALYGANLSGANLYGANLSRADLSGADFSVAALYGADFSKANLSGANLSGANLYRANLSGADLSGANLSGANLYGAHNVPKGAI